MLFIVGSVCPFSVSLELFSPRHKGYISAGLGMDSFYCCLTIEIVLTFTFDWRRNVRLSFTLCRIVDHSLLNITT